MTTGACECKVGYTNQQCNACDSGYFNAAYGTSSPFTCIGKLKNIGLHCSKVGSEIVIHISY